MQFTEFYATKQARRHILEKHRIQWKEVEEVLSGSVRGVRAADACGERRYVLDGRTAAGRKLRVIVAREPSEVVRVITAFEVRK